MCEKRKKIRRKKTKKLSQLLKSHISGTLAAISFKLGMWSAKVGGRALLEISLFTRVVYPQYMEQLIVWYFSSFSVNLHSLMFY